MIFALDGIEPHFNDKSSTWVAPTASVIGDVEISADVGIWFGAAVRGDTEKISIGPRSNIQENCVLHTDPGFPLTIGAGCTIGHKALLHGCIIGDNTLIGMGAIILNGAVIGDNCLVGAGALVTERKVFPAGSLIIGAPAKVARPLTENEITGIGRSSAHYVENQKRFAHGLKIANTLNEWSRPGDGADSYSRSLGGLDGSDRRI
jgi:carbonic anhydrase/acetyltransferase-like protein (isoleucine patch superfamily)